MSTEALGEHAQLLAAAVPAALVAEHIGVGEEITLEIDPQRLVEAARFLKTGPAGLTLCSDITCADFPDEPGRFRLAYHLFAPETGERIRLRVWAGAGDPEVPSVTGVWKTADWHEREVWDMFGVRFTGHPDLSRILMPYDWEGHPLRRDYPLGGEEVWFSDNV